MPGPSSSTLISTIAADLARAQRDPAARRAERLRVGDQVAQHLHQPVLDRPHHQTLGRRIDHQPRVILGIARRLVEFAQRVQDRHHVDRFGGDARQFGIQPRRVADVADQPVEPRHVLRDDGQQLALPLGVLDAAQRLDCAADRGQRVLDLVRHVGGEASRSRPSAPTAPALNPTAPWPARRPRRAAAAAAAARCRRGRGPRASRPRRRPAAGSAGRWSATGTTTAAPSAPAPGRTAPGWTCARRTGWSSTSRASRVSRTMPTVWRSRSTGSATVTSSRLSLVRRI